MIPIFMRSVIPHLTRGVIRSARSVSSYRAPVRSVSLSRAPSDHWFDRLVLNPITWAVVVYWSYRAEIGDTKRDDLIRETHDLAREATQAREARDALARGAGESKLDN